MSTVVLHCTSWGLSHVHRRKERASDIQAATGSGRSTTDARGPHPGAGYLPLRQVGARFSFGVVAGKTVRWLKETVVPMFSCKVLCPAMFVELLALASGRRKRVMCETFDLLLSVWEDCDGEWGRRVVWQS